MSPSNPKKYIMLSLNFPFWIINIKYVSTTLRIIRFSHCLYNRTQNMEKFKMCLLIPIRYSTVKNVQANHFALVWSYSYHHQQSCYKAKSQGPVDQLEDRHACNVEVAGSNPARSTLSPCSVVNTDSLSKFLRDFVHPARSISHFAHNVHG